MKRAIVGLACVFGVWATAFAEPMVGLTSTSTIVQFDSDDPGTITSFATVTGLVGGELLVGIDMRPASETLYALSTSGDVYAVNADTGELTFIAVTGTLPTGNAFDIDFNPTVDRIRVVSNLDQNIRITPLLGTVLIDTTLAYSGSDAHAGMDPNVVACAYMNNRSGATTTTLYGIDTGLDTLVFINPPNAGTLSTIGPLGVDAADATFDISGKSGNGFAAISTTAGGASSLYTINLSTGAATLLGSVGPGLNLVGIAAGVGTVTPPDEGLLMLTPDNALLHVRSATPQTVNATVPVTGLPLGEMLLGLDRRPADGNVYAVSDASALYQVNPLTGTVRFVGSFAPGVTGVAVGMDFNPTVDRIRLVSTGGDNTRVVPLTGALIVDTALNYQLGDDHFGLSPQVGAVAYANNVAGALTTTLYDIDLATGDLAIQVVPNAGALSTVGLLGISREGTDTGFDISGTTGAAYVTMTTGPLLGAALFTVDLATGAASLSGRVGDGVPVRDVTTVGNVTHTCDQNGDYVVSLAELLRVIQFYNSLGYQCAVSPGDTEDSYLPGPGASTGCAPHASDYAPQDWVISLAELLRAIQFYNSLGYHACPGEGTEDGFCPGAA